MHLEMMDGLAGPRKSNCVVSVWIVKGRALGAQPTLDHLAALTEGHH